MSVLRKATDILMLTESAKGRMNALLSQSMQTLEKEISASIYTLYNTLPEDADPYLDDEHETPNPAFVPYQSLTENQKLRRNIETAQAYFLLYHTIMSSKEINTKNVMLTRAVSGDGSLNPSDITEIDSFRKMLYNEGVIRCNEYKSTGDITVIVV